METEFYKKAADYWSVVPPTLEGVLGGFGFISDIDINGSKKFLNKLFALEKSPQKRKALDCGAGIGRITKDLLIDVFDSVDLVEQNPKFLEEAKNSIEPKSKIGDLYPIGLQNFMPIHKYDVIWCQWVLGHLNDSDLVTFFESCKNSLNKNGIIVVKENVTSSGNLEKDDVDSSFTRPLKHLLSIFKKSKLKIVKEYKQSNFPKGIYPVYMFALSPKDKIESKKEKDDLLNQDIDVNISQNLNDSSVKYLSSNFKSLSIDKTTTEEEDTILYNNNHQKSEITCPETNPS